MKISSAKNKGRVLQKWIVEQILSRTKLTENDVKSCSMGNNGMDVQLSEAARKEYPWATEAKNQERFKGIYDIYDQASKNATGLEPLVIIKINRQKPLAILDASLFFDLIFKKKEK